MNGGIAVRGIDKSFGKTLALDSVTFDCPPGAVTGYLGPNGSGKSTTLRIALGLSRPDRGEVLFGGFRLTMAGVNREVGAVLGPSFLAGPLRVRDELKRRSGYLGCGQSHAFALAEWAGLGSHLDKRISVLSLGEKQRLGVALAMLSTPTHLVLDEPFNGLDPEGIVWLRETLSAHAARGGTVLVSSHLIAELQSLVQHVVILRSGRVVLQGDPVEMMGPAATSVIFADASEAEAALSRAGLAWSMQGRHHVVEAPAVTVGELVAASQLVVLEMRPVQARGLERLYMQQVSGAAT